MNTLPKFFLPLFVILLCTFSVEAQLRNRYATLQNNFQNVNPAAINHLNISRLVGNQLLSVGFQNQQQDIDGTNSIGSSNLRVELVDPDAKVLFGGGITQEEVHIHKTTQVGGNFSYLVDLNSRGSSASNLSYLTLGLGGAANFQSTDLERLRYADQTDLVLPITSSTYGTVSGGAFYLYKRRNRPTIYGGVSAYHNVGTANNPASTQFFAVAGAIFAFANNALLVEPNTVMRYADYDGFLFNTITASPVSIDGGLRLWYDANGAFGFFGGANIGTNGRARVEMGFSVNAKKLGKGGPRITGKGQQKRNANSSNGLRIGYTYDFNYGSAFKTGTISEIFIALPIMINTRRK